MTLELRAPREDEGDAYLSFVGRAFSGTDTSEETLRAVRRTFVPERSIAIHDGAQLVATAASWGYPLTVPGVVTVPGAAVSRVAVRSTHRRRGLLSRMMRHQLEDVYRRGEPVAVLFASEAPIYGRFGYGLATYEAEVEVERARGGFRFPVDLSGVREVAASELPAIGVELAAKVGPRFPGFVQRDRAWWDVVAMDPAHFRMGSGQIIAVVHDGGAGPDGLAVYRMRMSDWDDVVVELQGLLAASERAYTALWRFCLDIDLARRLRTGARYPMEPVRHMLTDARAYRETLVDGLWLRVVDVPTALAARRYRAEGALTLRVEDPLCEWNAGEYALEAGPEGAHCVPARTSTPDLALSVAALGSVYLGTTPPSTLATAGLIEERTPGAVARADRLFAWPAPGWCPLHF